MRDAVEAHRGVFAIFPERDEPLSGAGLREATDALEARFESWGIAAGEIVGFMLPNGLAALELFVGTTAAGRIVLPFNLLAQDAQLDHVLMHAAPRVVFSAGENADRLEAAVARTRAKTRIERAPPLCIAFSRRTLTG